MSSEDDNEIFITQNSFNVTCDTNAAFDAVQNLLDFEDVWNDSTDKNSSKREKYQPAISDISDEELLATCEAVERQNTAMPATKCDVPDLKSAKRFRPERNDMTSLA